MPMREGEKEGEERIERRRGILFDSYTWNSTFLKILVLYISSFECSPLKNILLHSLSTWCLEARHRFGVRMYSSASLYKITEIWFQYCENAQIDIQLTKFKVVWFLFVKMETFRFKVHLMLFAIFT